MAFHWSPIGRTHDHPCQWTHLCTNHILLAISTTSEGPHIVMPEASQKLHLSGNMNPMMPNAPSPPSPPPLHPVFTSLKIRLPSTRSWKASVIFFTSFFCQTKKKDTSQNLNWSGYLLPWKMDKKMSKNLLSHEVWTKSEILWQRIVHTNGHLDRHLDTRWGPSCQDSANFVPVFGSWNEATVPYAPEPTWWPRLVV